MKSFTRSRILGCTWTVLSLAAFSSTPSFGQPLYDGINFSGSGITATRVGKAQPDECFFRRPYEFSDNLQTNENDQQVSDYMKSDFETGLYYGSPALAACLASNRVNAADGGKVYEGWPKVNQSYLWGLTKCKGKVWFGTGPNMQTLAGVSFDGGGAQESGGGGRQPGFTLPADSSVEERGTGAFFKTYITNVNEYVLGDWRPPDIFCYEVGVATPPINKSLTNDFPVGGADFDNLYDLFGCRSAGCNDDALEGQGIVILGGPSRTIKSQGPAIVLFAFNATTCELIGSKRIEGYVNIRKMTLHDGQLYLAVTKPNLGGGAVLRWKKEDVELGNDDPFLFEEIATLDNGGGEIVFHEGRLFVNTWPFSEDLDIENVDFNAAIESLLLAPPGLYMSPVIPPGGLTAAHADQWVKVFSWRQYDPDILVAASYGGGPMASFGGYLYFSSIHFPGASSLVYNIIYGNEINPLPGESDIDVPGGGFFDNTTRLTCMLRGRNFSETPIGFGLGLLPPFAEIDVVYGEKEFPVFNPVSRHWQFQPNRLRKDPLFGFSGYLPFSFFQATDALFDDFNFSGNFYTWSMAVCNDALYWGTFDILTLFSEPSLPPDLSIPSFGLDTTLARGADFYCMPSPNAPGRLVSGNGFGNYLSHGFRNMIECDGELYVGTATGFNLTTDFEGDFSPSLQFISPDWPTDYVLPEGGWELWQVTKDEDCGEDVLSPNNDEKISNTRRPPFFWCPEEGATWYKITLTLDGAPYFSRWFRQTDAAWVPDFDLACGQYDWTVKGWRLFGGSTAEQEGSFRIACCSDLDVTVSAQNVNRPSGDVRYTVSTEGEPCSGWVQLWINREGKKHHAEWYKGTLSILRLAEPAGDYQVWARRWTVDDGYGPWSDVYEFSIGKLEQVNLLPTETSSRICWYNNSGAGMTWFHLWVEDDSGALVFRKWVQLEDTFFESVDGPANDRRCYELESPLPFDNTYHVWVRGWEPPNVFGKWSDEAIIEYTEPTPELEVTKILDNEPESGCYEDGDEAEFIIIVRNIGNEDLVNVFAEDPLAPDCDGTFGGTIEASGGVRSYSCSLDLDGVTESFTNTVTVTGTGVLSGNLINVSNEVEVVICPSPP